jgi:carboxyl-terminal processing protease
VMANDIITHLDDNAVQGLTIDQAVDKMRGPVNTKIKLTIVLLWRHRATQSA